MTRKQRRGLFIGSGMAILGVAVTLVLYNLSGSIMYFYSPTDMVEKQIRPGTRVRLGGLIGEGSLKRGTNNHADFSVTDTKSTINVSYVGSSPLPELVSEKQGVIAEGEINTEGKFISSYVLAKHDEKYMPREIADSLKKQGYWKTDDQGSAATAKPASK